MQPFRKLVDELYRDEVLEARRTPPEVKLLEAARLCDTTRQVMADAAFKVAADKAGTSPDVLKYGDRASCTAYAQAMVALVDEYRPILTAKKKK